MEIVTTVINPINNEEVEVTLSVTVMVSISEDRSVLNVQAFGSQEL
jgi:hypothetical protein